MGRQGTVFGAQGIARILERGVLSAKNAIELLRVGRLGEAYGSPFEVVLEGEHFRLRRYASPKGAPIALLVPPLMVTSEVYDLERDHSAVSILGRNGIAPYVIDFGAPEDVHGGMKRTLDDHVLAVVAAIRWIHETTGRRVHLLGYSQGGMFAYQAAAFLRSEGVRSIVTFGSPVDLHKGLPLVHSDATRVIAEVAEPFAVAFAELFEGLPGELTATLFKLVSTKKELEQRLDFLRKLHDRGALMRREARRRFLGGEGFVAWPGPAFRAFVDQFIVHNRMLSGGFVLAGRTVTLADLECPILAFLGGHDEIARPATVRAIVRAAPHAEVQFATVASGHFGIVVGTQAREVTWPTVAGWIQHHEGASALPRGIAPLQKATTVGQEDEPEGAGFHVDIDFQLLFDVVADGARGAWRRAGDVFTQVSDLSDSIRYQEPRLRALADLQGEQEWSVSRLLREHAQKTPDETFFLWDGRAFSFGQANARITSVAKGLYSKGIKKGVRVGVAMPTRPSLLAALTALIRLGAVPVLAPEGADQRAVASAFREASIEAVLTHPTDTPFDWGVPTYTLGVRRASYPASNAFDLEALDVTTVVIPDDDQDCAHVSDEALIVLRPKGAGSFRALSITQHRWALSALGTALSCSLKPSDTVFSSLPLTHPAGFMVAVGSALVAGCRLALSHGEHTPSSYLAEIRRTGATVAFYAGEHLRALSLSPPSRGDRDLPLRLFAGSGMRRDLWKRLIERFGVGVMEFYASTEHRLVIANASGAKIGSVGRRLPGSESFSIAKFDPETRALLRDSDGQIVPVEDGTPGLLVVHTGEALGAEPPALSPLEVVVRRDEDGDLWIVGRVDEVRSTPRGLISLRAIEDALYTAHGVEAAIAWFDETGRPVALVSSDAPIHPEAGRAALALLPDFERPAIVRFTRGLPLVESVRPRLEDAQHRFAGADPWL